MWQAPSPIRLEDYRPTDYIIEAVDLHFELEQTEDGFFQSAVGFRNGRSDRQRQRIDLYL